MPATRSARSHSLWDEAKRHAVVDIRQMIEEQAPRVEAALETLSATVKQERSDALAGLSQDWATALQLRAPRVHAHAAGDIIGLVTLLATLNQKIAALEARVAVLEG